MAYQAKLQPITRKVPQSFGGNLIPRAPKVNYSRPLRYLSQAYCRSGIGSEYFNREGMLVFEKGWLHYSADHSGSILNIYW